MNYVDPKVQEALDLTQALATMDDGEDADRREAGVTRHAMTGRIIAGPDGGDDQLTVIFTTEAVYSKRDTYLAGGVPTYIDIDHVTISIPGGMFTTVHRAVTDFDKWRFPVEYKRFKEGQSSIVSGTPLSMWSALSPSHIKTLESAGVRTIEQAASLSDSTMGIPGLQKLKRDAKAYLDQAQDVAAKGRLQAEFDMRDKQHAADMTAMQAQQAELLKQLQALQKKADDKKK